MEKGAKGNGMKKHGRSGKLLGAFVLSLPFMPHRSLLLLPLFYLLFVAPLAAQEPVAPVTGWLATVDEATQQIVLSWHPSADASAMGYHICSGTPCLDYDTVYGRMDTTYRCVDHAATERHSYRIHVFDSAYNVSSLTPSFGNVVLTADVPRCSTEVTALWTPYEGMPGGVGQYSLLARLEPYDTAYHPLIVADSTGTFAHTFTIAEGTTRVWLKVQVVGGADSTLVSTSNIVAVDRFTVDTAAFFDILSLDYDSLFCRALLALSLDTAYHANPYVLSRSIDGNPWDSLAAIAPTEVPFHYVDSDINPFDSLYCYRLSVLDACGLNPRHSDSLCMVVPTPPEPAQAIPNIVVVGDDANGTFLPRLRGLKGDLYELFVYNRNGLLVYSTSDPDAGWTPSSSTPQGAYAYSLRVRFNNNRIKIFTGSVLVIK